MNLTHCRSASCVVTADFLGPDSAKPSTWAEACPKWQSRPRQRTKTGTRQFPESLPSRGPAATTNSSREPKTAKQPSQCPPPRDRRRHGHEGADDVGKAGDHQSHDNLRFGQTVRQRSRTRRPRREFIRLLDRLVRPRSFVPLQIDESGPITADSLTPNLPRGSNRWCRPSTVVASVLNRALWRLPLPQPSCPLR